MDSQDISGPAGLQSKSREPMRDAYFPHVTIGSYCSLKLAR